MSVSNFDINLWAVLLAGVASMVIGMVYYSNAAFGKEWKKLAKIEEKRFQKEMPRVMPVVFAGALITAYIVAYITNLYQTFFDISWLGAGVVSALIIWFVVATNIYIHNSLDQRPTKLSVISLGNRLLSIVAMGLIIGWLHP
ncbi:MAG TPA: DUF1761 domain-containing protein [Verrucomicrobiae bacterium]|jgi:hypothetical protein|nr:DUF1761 domain-containing protein [Verrucomicrobiae bacterium]